MEISNRKAKFDYQIAEEIEAGIILEGWEVKALRSGHCSLKGSYCFFDGKTIALKGCKITPLIQSAYMAAGRDERERKLLLNKREIVSLRTFLGVKGNTLIPLKIYFSDNGFAKLSIGKATGKKKHDKRQAIREKDLEREAQREMKDFGCS